MMSHLPGHRNAAICRIQDGLWSLGVHQMGICPPPGCDPHAPSQVQGHCPADSSFRLSS